MAQNYNAENSVAVTDYLTGLHNRRGLYEFYENSSENLVHAMFIDVDNFKRVNDVYGHSTGDVLLIQIARLIEKSVKGFVSRIGGDEFVVICDSKFSEEQMMEVAAGLLKNMENLNFRRDILSGVSLSVGLVLDQSTRLSLDDVLAKCDSAMYQAKMNGKNRYFIYREDDENRLLSKSIEATMEEAFKNGEFCVFFQPKMNVLTSSLVGAEALSRWILSDGSIRYPDVYIPIFEKNGFISQLDMFMYEEVCKFKKSWKGKEYEHLPISINMSRLHLYNKIFPDRLADIAEQYGIPTNELEIEIAEGIFIRDTREMIRVVDMLKEKGFRVSIDDFGSGFSALNLLKDMPTTTVKLDKAFLKESSESVRGRKVIRNVITMCKDLKLDVVCEGVELKSQVDFISSCGCQIAQGFFYSEALCLEAFETYAEAHFRDNATYYRFRMNGNLKADDSSLEGEMIGSDFFYVEGIRTGYQALRFPGGPLRQNVVKLPNEVLTNDSFTITMWVRPLMNQNWSAAFFVNYENGFMGILPLSVDGLSGTRFKDRNDISGWNDVFGCALQENKWYHYAITYNARTEKAIAFINGQVVAMLENVPTNRFVKEILVGGDDFQKSFCGDICELIIYNASLDYDALAVMHDRYRRSPDFIGFAVDDLEEVE